MNNDFMKFNLNELLDDYATLTYAIGRYNTITEREGVKTYEQIALSDNYFNALVDLCKKYKIEFDINYDKKLEEILTMETIMQYELKKFILEFGDFNEC